MCLEQEVIAELFARLQALWLSERRGKGETEGKERRESKRQIQRASLSACVIE